MVYTLLTTPAAHKSFKKLPKHIAHALIEALAVLAENPLEGQQLSGRYHFLRSFHWRYQGTQYRVVYQVDTVKSEILIHHAATRENFYRVLDQLKLKPTV